jgi:predicted nucleic acid-binding protein
MIACCDTSFLYALYGNDAHSTTAVTMLASLSSRLTISGLNDFELTNALHHAAWRGLLTKNEVNSRLGEFARSRNEGRIFVAPCDFAAVTRQARELAVKWTPSQGNRAFDILHVATALHLRADLFLTFDARQRSLAAAEGLRIEI